MFTLTELKARGYIKPATERKYNAKGEELLDPYQWSDDYKRAVDDAVLRALTAARNRPVKGVLIYRHEIAAITHAEGWNGLL